VKASPFLPFLLLALPGVLAQTKPIPPGIRQADKVEAQTQKNIPPPVTQHSRADLTKARQEAEQLSKLAQTIPSDVEQVTKGVFPKDLIEKLKQIENLSKHLRSELKQ
jgi:hypothetical protein